jgi:hypothetical protein
MIDWNTMTESNNRVRQFVKTLALTAARAVIRRYEPEAPRVVRITHNDEWRLAIMVFVLWFDRYNLSYNAMRRAGLVEDGLMTRKAYDICSDWLALAECIVKQERHATRWAGPWNRKRVQRYLKFDLMPIPYPNEPPPPCLLARAQNTHSTEPRIPPIRALAA